MKQHGAFRTEGGYRCDFAQRSFGEQLTQHVAGSDSFETGIERIGIRLRESGPCVDDVYFPCCLNHAVMPKQVAGHQRLSDKHGNSAGVKPRPHWRQARSEEHTSELQSLMRISYAVFCLKKKTKTQDKGHKHVKH